MINPSITITKFDNNDVITTSISLLYVGNGTPGDAVFKSVGVSNIKDGSIDGTDGSAASIDRLIIYGNNGSPQYASYTQIFLYPSKTAESGKLLSTIMNDDENLDYASYAGSYTYEKYDIPNGKKNYYYIFRNNQ